MTSFFLCSLHCVPYKFTVTRLFSFTRVSTAAMASVVTTRCAWPGRGESVTELMPFMKFLVHSYTCCNDRHAAPYWTLIHGRISMGITPSLLKKRMTERCSSLVHVPSGAAIFTLLLRRRVAFLHRTTICRPHFKPWVSLLSTYRQSRCVSNLYRTFKVFIWLSLVYKRKNDFTLQCEMRLTDLPLQQCNKWTSKSVRDENEHNPF